MKRFLIAITLLTLVLSLDALILAQQDAPPTSAPQTQQAPSDGEEQGGAPPVQEPPEYPAGEFCKRPDDVKSAKDHPCHCRDMEKCTMPDHGQGTGPSENNTCSQWCHKDHCKCQVKCE